MSMHMDPHDRKRLSALDTNYWRNTSSNGLPTPDDAAYYTPISCPVTPADPPYYGSSLTVLKPGDATSRMSLSRSRHHPPESRLSCSKVSNSSRGDYPSPTKLAPSLEKIPEIYTSDHQSGYIVSPPVISKTESRKSRRLSNLNPTPKSPTTPDPGPFLSSMASQPREKILFYHKQDAHYGFTNFSSHAVVYQGKRYPTSEHLFQSFKFQGHRPGLAEHIRTCSERPSVAFSEARRFQPEVRPDWKHVNIAMMDVTLEHKFTQHADLMQELLGTDDAELVEDSDKDAFWGVGVDGKGRNELGKALERLRGKLRARL